MATTADPGPAARVEDVLRAAGQPLGVADVARALGVHPTTARFHLERLEAAGTVGVEAGSPAGRGRPARRYRLLDAVDARLRMVQALAEALAGGGPVAGRAERAGERWGAGLEAPATDAVAAVEGTFAELGFAPERDGTGLRLRACPFLEAARRHPEAVCAVHLGLARTVVRRAGETGEVTLVPFAPGGCRLAVAAR